MVTEGAINPVAILVHVLGIAAGIFLGFLAMDAIAPDLPTNEDPGLASSVAPESVGGGDGNSLFTAPELAAALVRIESQLATDEGIVSMHIEPGSIDADTAEGEGLLAPSEIYSELPRNLVGRIGGTTGRDISLDDVAYIDIVVTDSGPRVYLQLDTDQIEFPPPWTYSADIDTGNITAGGPPPVPVDP